MGVTASGDYILPGKSKIAFGNFLLAFTDKVPRFVFDIISERHKYYQAFNRDMAENSQGLSMNKWRVMNVPEDLSGKTVLDIGCAEGFFCLEAARRGAKTVIGIDSRFNTLLAAKALARRLELPVTYRLDVFPELLFRGKFDYVFCLSVLHHMVSTKDIWKVLTNDAFIKDRENLISYSTVLKNRTAKGGTCILEIPYEYDETPMPGSVIFTKFNDILFKAGFDNVVCTGEWDHEEANIPRKNRVIYTAYVSKT